MTPRFLLSTKNPLVPRPSSHLVPRALCAQHRPHTCGLAMIYTPDCLLHCIIVLTVPSTMSQVIFDDFYAVTEVADNLDPDDVIGSMHSQAGTRVLPIESSISTIPAVTRSGDQSPFGYLCGYDNFFAAVDAAAQLNRPVGDFIYAEYTACNATCNQTDSCTSVT